MVFIRHIRFREYTLTSRFNICIPWLGNRMEVGNKPSNNHKKNNSNNSRRKTLCETNYDENWKWKVFNGKHMQDKDGYRHYFSLIQRDIGLWPYSYNMFFFSVFLFEENVLVAALLLCTQICDEKKKMRSR